MTVTPDQADFIIDNNGTLDDLSRNVDAAYAAAIVAVLNARETAQNRSTDALAA